ncbi:AAA family ATPase [Janibacter sp. DB-40]|uniref:ATP-binding protein n=1 Tax=Janibacter sp. DB-40 TaxID=3028808 RepID=UPI0024050C02|nr:AAA family ATPase [Janibacter sp. DB-40]
MGRTAELAKVERALVEARAGRGRLLLVTGPAGIGKTRLADAAVESARGARMGVATGYAIDDPGAPPLWPWLRAMREWPETRSLPSSDGSEPESAARFRLFVAICDLLRARADDGGLLVVLEDMHWADRTSLLLLRHLCAELHQSRIMVVVTGRDGVHGPFADAGPDLARGDSASSIVLAGLATDEIVRWLAHLSGGDVGLVELAKMLEHATNGNPLLIRLLVEELAGRDTSRGGGEVLGQLMSERPHLRRIVATKVAPLGPDARELVEAAAVLGERVSPDVLAAMVTASVGPVRALLDDAVATRLLIEENDTGELRFQHALIRDAVYGEVPAGRRRDLHRPAAEVLEQYRPESAAGSIAHHWHRAGGSEGARGSMRWAQRADDDARAVLAFDDAAGFAALAVAAAEACGVDAEERARLVIRRAEALYLASRVRESLDCCVHAADLAERCHRADLVAQAALVVHGLGDPDANRIIPRLAARALSLVDPGDHATRARLRAQIAIGAAETGDGPEAAVLAAAALAEAEVSGDPAALLECIAAWHLTISIPQTVRERLELGRRATQLGSAAGQPIAALWGHLWRIDAAVQLGDMGAVDEGLSDLDRVARERGSVLARWHHLRFLAVREALHGDFAAAGACNDAAREIAVRMGDLSMIAMDHAFRFEMMRLRGLFDDEPDGWRDVIRRAPPLPLVRVQLPMVSALAGDLDRARAEFEEFRHVPRSLAVGVRWAGTVRQIAAVAVLLGDVDVCATAYELFLPFAHAYSGDGSGGVFSDGAVARSLADYAIVAGRPEQALGHYREAIAMNVRIGARPFTALSRLGLARTLTLLGPDHRTDEDETVSTLLERTAGEFRRLAMPGPLEAADALATSVRPRDR